MRNYFPLKNNRDLKKFVQHSKQKYLKNRFYYSQFVEFEAIQCFPFFKIRYAVNPKKGTVSEVNRYGKLTTKHLWNKILKLKEDQEHFFLQKGSLSLLMKYLQKDEQ